MVALRDSLSKASYSIKRPMAINGSWLAVMVLVDEPAFTYFSSKVNDFTVGGIGITNDEAMSTKKPAIEVSLSLL